MSTSNNGGSAFPCLPPQDTAAGSAVGYPHPEAGMSLRDYFAAKAMQAVLINSDRASTAVDEVDLWIGSYAYTVADAMLKARAA